MLEILEDIFLVAVEYIVLFLEATAAIVLAGSAIRALLDIGRAKGHTQMILAQGISLALEFMMGGEVLRSATVKEPAVELLTLGATVLLRGAMAFLIHWESSNEKKDLLEEEERERLQKEREEERAQVLAAQDPAGGEKASS